LSNILASKSNRRKKILKKIDFNFSVIPSNVKEDLRIGLIPEALVEHWAREKAKVISLSNPTDLIIGADTIVLVNSKVVGKPTSKAKSFEILKSLSGKMHSVITGVSLIHLDLNLDITFNATTNVYVRDLNDDDINNYIDNYKPFDKAGSYGIQDKFCAYISGIDGCYYNVMGFPVSLFHSRYQSIRGLVDNYYKQAQ
tara:strand:- start:39 stop:632 length:594 start_codon:yes stop_codon:yes gene_type:complete